MLWLFFAVYSFVPFYGLDERYVYDDQFPLCYQRPNGIISLIILYVFLPCVTTAIIIVTSLWTFCFTRSFFNAQSVIAGESVYVSKKKRLFGVLLALQHFIDLPPELFISIVNL